MRGTVEGEWQGSSHYPALHTGPALLVSDSQEASVPDHRPLGLSVAGSAFDLSQSIYSKFLVSFFFSFDITAFLKYFFGL